MKRYIFLAVAALLMMSAGTAADPPLIRALQSYDPVWVQLTPGGGAEIRAVIAHGCPAVVFDDQVSRQIPMQARADDNADFPFVCSLPIPPGTRSAAIVASPLRGGAVFKPVRLPVAEPQRILVLGDTGCRISKFAVQACNDPKAWPFAGLSAAAAALKPDLVVHLGDYLYREVPCPEGNAGCAGTPYGDKWPTWAADFFTPAAPLLSAAPWVVIRGNHEDCQRAGPGFQRLLGPGAYDAAVPCPDHIDPYAVQAGRQTIAVMDNATASDTTLDDKAVETYARDFALIRAMAHGRHKVWLANHRPIWAAITGPAGVPIGGNINLITAAGNLSAFQAVSLMLSGHIHTFEAINYNRSLPPQIVAGHGGDNLDVTPLDLKHAIFQGHSGVNVKDGLSVGGFGFLMMTKSGAGWSIQLYDSDGTPKRECRFAAGRVDCPN